MVIGPGSTRVANWTLVANRGRLINTNPVTSRLRALAHRGRAIQDGQVTEADPLLQMQWDAAMLRAWVNDWRTSYLLKTFRARNVDVWGVEQIFALKRRPFPAAKDAPVRVFVAYGLPILSEWLWNGASVADCAALLSGRYAAMDTKKGHFHDRELAQGQTRLRQMRRVDINVGHRRSDWQVCKA